MQTQFLSDILFAGDAAVKCPAYTQRPITLWRGSHNVLTSGVLMRLPHLAFLALLGPVALACAAQVPATGAPTPAPAPATTAPAPQAAEPVPAMPIPAAPSSFLKPALDGVRQTLGSLDLERWKKGGIRDEAMREISAILQDMQENLPPLMNDADAAPGAISKTLPLSRHIDALYDVLLRVEEASRVVATGEQVDQLQLALKNLGEARLALDKQLQELAVAHEQQITNLSTRLEAALAVKCPPPPPPPVCPPPTTHKARKKKPAAATEQKKSTTPATTAPTTPK